MASTTIEDFLTKKLFIEKDIVRNVLRHFTVASRTAAFIGHLPFS